MGMSTKKTTTQATNNGTSSMTSTPTNPEWVTKGTEGLGGSINDFFKNLDPTSLVAGPDALQTQAGQGAAGLGQGTSALYGEARDWLRGAMGAGANTYNPATMSAASYDPSQGTATMGTAHTGQSASLLDNLGSYMSPYTKDVVDTSLADYDYGAGKTRAQQALDLAGSPFAGSRAGVAQSLTEGELNRGRGALSAGLRDQAFNTGAQLSGQDADRRQGMSLANMNALNTQGLTNQNASNAYGLANMDAINTAGSTNAGFLQGARTNNQNALNSAGQFNAGQQDANLNRQMVGAEGLSTMAGAQDANSRANIGTQGSIGSMLQALSQAKAGSPLAALAAQTGLWGQLPFDLTKGMSGTGTTNSTSTGKSKESGAGLGDWLSFFAANAANAAQASGGGG